MAKKKSGQKKPTAARVGAVSPLPQENGNAGNGEVATPTEVKADNKEQVESESKNEDIKDATSPTEPATPTAETPVATTPITTESPSAPLTKSQKKRARKANAGGAIITDTEPVQTTEKPSDNPESTAVANELGGTKAENEEPTTPAEVEDAWGFDEAKAGEPPVETEATGEPDVKNVGDAAPSEAGTVIASKIEVADAAPEVAALDSATSDDTRKADGTLDADPTATAACAVPAAHPDAATGSGDAPSQTPKQGTLPLQTVDGDPAPAPTEPNVMPAPRLPNDDDAPRVPAKTTTRAPTIDTNLPIPAASTRHDTNFTSSAQVEPHGLGLTATPTRASPAGPSSSPTAVTSGQGLFSSGTVKPPSASSPTSGVSGTRGPGVVGFGSARSTQFGFGQQKPNLPPPPSATPGPSWGAPKPVATPSKPAAKTGGWGWGGISNLVNKAQNVLETALADETPSPGPSGQRALPPRPSPAPQPAPTLRAPEPAPAPKKSSVDERLAALRAKQAARKAASVPPKDQPKPEPPKPVEPPVKSVELPVEPVESLVKPATPPPITVMNAEVPEPVLSPKPTTSLSPKPIAPLSLSPDNPSILEAKVTSTPIPPQLAASDSVDLEAVPYERAESVVSSKTAGSGLRLNVPPVSDAGEDKGKAASTGAATPLMNKRPNLADMRSTSSPSPKTGGFSAFGAGLGGGYGSNRFGAGRVGFGGFGAPGGRAMFGPIGESSKESKEKDKVDDDLSSVVAESVQDVDSLVEGGEKEEEPQLGTTEDLAALLDPTAKPEPVAEPAPEPVVVPAPEPIVASAPEPVVASTPEPITASAPEHEPERVVLSKPVVTSGPIAVPEPVVVPEHVATPEPVVTSEPIVASAPEPEFVVAPTLEPESFVVEFEPESFVVASEPEPVVAAPEPESIAAPEPIPAAPASGHLFELPELDEVELGLQDVDLDLDDKTVAPDARSPEREPMELPPVEPAPVLPSLGGMFNPWNDETHAAEPVVAEPGVVAEPAAVESTPLAELVSARELAVVRKPVVSGDVVSTSEPPATESPVVDVLAIEPPMAEFPAIESPAVEAPTTESAPIPESVDLPPTDVETPKPVEEPTLVEENKPVENPTPVEPTPVAEPAPVEEIKSAEEIKPAEETAPVEEATPVEDPEPAEEVKLVEEIKPAEETKSIEEAPPIEAAPVPMPEPAPQPWNDAALISSKRGKGKRAKKQNDMKPAVEVPDSTEWSSAPKSPVPEAAMPKSPLPPISKPLLPTLAIPESPIPAFTSPIPASSVPKSPLPATPVLKSPLAASTVPPTPSSSKKKKKKNKKGADAVEEPVLAPTPAVESTPVVVGETPVTAEPEPVVEPTPAAVEELVVVEEAPTAAEAVQEEVAVEAPASTEVPLIDLEPVPTPATVEPTPDAVELVVAADSAPEVIEPTLTAPEPEPETQPEHIVAPESEPEAAVAPAPVEPAPEASLPETKVEEPALIETKDEPPTPEPAADTLATPKAEEKPLPDEPKEVAPRPTIVIPVEEPQPKEEPTSPALPTSAMTKKAAKAAKKARKKSLAQQSEPAPVGVVEVQPVSPVAVEAQPTSPVVEAQLVTPILAAPEVVETPSEVVEAPSEVVPAVDPTPVVDEPVKSNDEVEGPVDESFATPKPTVQALPEIVDHVVEEVPVPIVEPVAEEVKAEELVVMSGVEEPVIEPEVEVQKVEEPEVEVQKVEEPEAKTPKVEPVMIEEPMIEEPQLEEPTAKDPPVEELVVVAFEPVVETAPVAEEPKPEDPKPEVLAIEVPAVEAPRADVPVAEPETPATPVVESSKKNRKKKKKEKTNAKVEPAIEAPAVEVPVVETPAVETPVVETLVVEAPVVEAPAVVEPSPQAVVEEDEAAPEEKAGPVAAPVAIPEPVVQPAVPQTPVEPARAVSPIPPKEKAKAAVIPSPVTPAEGRFSFFSSFVRKARLLPEVVPEAPARVEHHSPTPSELALDLDTPVNLTPKVAGTKLPEVQPPIEVAAAVVVPSAPPSEPPTPGPRHDLLEKKLAMALEEAEASIDQQEIHPENTSMPDPPPAYSSPKMEPTVPTSVPEPARVPEPTPVTQPVAVAEPTVIAQPEVITQPEVVAQPEVPQPANTDQSEVTEPIVVAPPEVATQPIVVPSSILSPQPVAFAQSMIPETTWVRRKTKSSKKSMRDKTPDPPRKVELAIPVSPVVASVVVPEEPVVALFPVSSKPIVESVKGPSPAPNESFAPIPQLLSPKSRGSVSTMPPYIDEGVRSASPGKSRSHTAMPPLISIPVTNLPHSPLPSKSPLAKERDYTSEAETPLQPLPSPPAPTKDEPEKAPSPPTVLSKPHEGFSPFRWFGFNPPTPPPAPAEKAPEPAPKSEVAPPTPVSPVKEEKKGKEKERKEKSSKTPSVSTNNIVLTRTPTSPSPMVEKIEWSRWQNQPAASSTEPKLERPSVVRDSQAGPTGIESRTATSRSGSSGTATPVVFSPVPPGPPPVTPVSAIPTATTRVTLARTVASTASVPVISIPAIPIIPASAVAPSIPAPRVDPHRATPRDVSVPNTTSAITQEATRPKDTALAREERRKARAEKLAAAMRAASPSSYTPSVSFQSPRSTDEPLPAHLPNLARAEFFEADAKPAPRGILKQRSVDPAPTLSIPVVPSTRASSQSSRLEFTGSRDVPIYDDWEHAPKIRQDLLAATSSVRSPRERRTPTASPISPSTGRSHPAGDSRHRLRPPAPAAEATSPSSRVIPAYAPSPSRESRTPTRSGHTQPEFVPVLNDQIPRTKATRPSRISTVTAQRRPGSYAEPLTSPILLTSENYCTRVPEGTIYQYDGISPSDSLAPATRKQILDALQKTVAPQVFTPLARASYDGGKMMYAHRKLDVSSRQEFMIELPESGQGCRVYTVRLRRMAEIAPQIAHAFCG